MLEFEVDHLPWEVLTLTVLYMCPAIDEISIGVPVSGNLAKLCSWMDIQMGTDRKFTEILEINYQVHIVFYYHCNYLWYA